jgi:hypothetical protein
MSAMPIPGCAEQPHEARRSIAAVARAGIGLVKRKNPFTYRCGGSAGLYRAICAGVCRVVATALVWRRMLRIATLLAAAALLAAAVLR